MALQAAAAEGPPEGIHSLADISRVHSRLTPQRPALAFEGRTITYAQLDERASQVAQGLIDQDVDVLLPVGGPIYQSAAAAMREAGRDIALIGVDADFTETDPDVADLVLTSILKGIDVGTYEAVLAAGQGDFDATPFIGTLENEGVGIAPFHDFESKVSDTLQGELDELKDAIIAGDIEVKSYLAG